MSLPLIFNDNCYSMYPSRIMDKQFGITLEDLLSPMNHTIVRCPTDYCRPPWRYTAAKGDAGSPTINNKDKFHVNLDVQQFKPEEITMKVGGSNIITVEGKHEEKEDEHGFVARHFIRRFILPDGHDINNVISNLSSDGVLSITAPRIDQTKEEHHTVSIHQTGVPSKPLENRWVSDNKVDQKKD